MSDIAACPGHGCPKKETCYRYTAPWSEWQGFADFWIQDDVKDGKCPHYWPNEAELKRIDDNASTKSREA